VRTPRVSVPGGVRAGDRLVLPADEGRHLAVVLRRAPGDPVIILAASGGAHRGVIEAVDGPGEAARVTVAVGEEAAGEGPPVLPWVAAVALLRGDAFDLAVRMAAELGLEAVLPVITERTVVRGPGRGRVRGAAGKEERWRRTAREAAKQCGREAPLGVLRTRSLADAVEAWSRDRSLPDDFPRGPARRGRVLVPGGPFRPEDFLGPGGEEPAPAVFLIGPEGGFTPGEVARAAAAGFEPVGFPVPVLRTPTAVALLGALGAVARAGFASPRAPPQGPDPAPGPGSLAVGPGGGVS
jgi:16S rRNA (uracil1498-N3)-methyltransferase